jgi:hypothetical protein
MITPRDSRVRALEALRRTAKQFRSRRELWPMRVPREPVPLDEVIAQALPDARRAFDPLTLRSRTLLHLTWDDGSTWEAFVVALSSNLHLYCDSGGGEMRILASARRDAEGGDVDRFFLELLSESAGEDFGIEMSGGAPSRVRSPLDREFLVEVFVNLFELTHAEDSVRAQLKSEDAQHDDFRADVERWLDATTG